MESTDSLECLVKPESKKQPGSEVFTIKVALVCLLISILKLNFVTFDYHSFFYHCDVPFFGTEILTEPVGKNFECDVYVLENKIEMQLPFETQIYIGHHPDTYIKSCWQMHEIDERFTMFFEPNYRSKYFMPEYRLPCERKPPKHQFPVIAKALGSIVFGVIGDKFGRMFGFGCSTILFMFSEILFFFQSANIFGYIAEFLMKFCFLGGLATLFTLLLEISSKTSRSFVMIVPSFVMLDQTDPSLMISFWGNKILRSLDDMRASIVMPVLCVCALLWLLEESPRFLATRVKQLEACQVLNDKSFRVNNASLKEPQMESSFFYEIKSVLTNQICRREALMCFVILGCLKFLSMFVKIGNTPKDVSIVDKSYILPLMLEFLVVVVIFAEISTRRHQQLAAITIFGASCFIIILKVQGYFWLNLHLIHPYFYLIVNVLTLLRLAEIFPTEIRCTAIGLGFAVLELIDFMMKVLDFYFGPYEFSTTAFILTIVTLITIAAFLSYKLPETKGKHLKNHLSEVNYRIV